MTLPPILSPAEFNGAPGPQAQLARLMEVLLARISKLYAPQPNTPAATARALWTLHTLGTAYTALCQMRDTQPFPADAVCAQLRLLAAGLISVTTVDAQAAAALNAALSFAALDRLVRALLDETAHAATAA